MLRALSAHNNHFEAFIGFSAAVLLCLVKKDTDLAELTILCNGFIFVRILYNIVYLIAFNAPLSVVRTGVFSVGIIIVLRIFTLGAGDIMNKV